MRKLLSIKDISLSKKLIFIPLVSILSLMLFMYIAVDGYFEQQSLINSIRHKAFKNFISLHQQSSNILEQHLSITNLLIEANQGLDPGEVYERGLVKIDNLNIDLKNLKQTCETTRQFFHRHSRSTREPRGS